jgi:hypothetical protein
MEGRAKGGLVQPGGGLCSRRCIIVNMFCRRVRIVDMFERRLIDIGALSGSIIAVRSPIRHQRTPLLSKILSPVCGLHPFRHMPLIYMAFYQISAPGASSTAP